MTLRGSPTRSSSAAETVPGVREDDIQMIATDFLTEGVVEGWGGELEVTERGAGANMSVDVASGRCYIDVTTTHLTPDVTYLPRLENSATVNLPVPTADGTNPRKDRIVAKWVVGTDPNGTASNIVSIELLEGTPAGSPTAPAVPSNAISLAIVDVPASDTTITDNQITDDRSFVQVQADVLQDLARQAELEELYTTANGEGASKIGVEDAATNFTGDNVEEVLAELQDNIDAIVIPPDSGDQAYSDTDGYTAGAVNDDPISNTASETAFAKTYTVPANFFSAQGVRGRVTAFGQTRSKASGAGTLTWNLYLGSDLVGTVTATMTDNVDNQKWFLEAEIVCHAAGASGELFAIMRLRYEGSSTKDYWTYRFPNRGAATPIVGNGLDLTATQALTLKMQFSAADTANYVDLAALNLTKFF